MQTRHHSRFADGPAKSARLARPILDFQVRNVRVDFRTHDSESPPFMNRQRCGYAAVRMDARMIDINLCGRLSDRRLYPPQTYVNLNVLQLIEVSESRHIAVPSEIQREVGKNGEPRLISLPL